MGEIVTTFLKISLKVAVTIGLIISFLAIYIMAIDLMNVALNHTIISEFIGIIQIWLPFNISTMMFYIFTFTGLYITYRLAIYMLNLLTNTING